MAAVLSNDAHRQAVCNLIVRKMLLRGSLTRREIGQTVDLSPAAVTHHTRWLLKHRVIQSHKKKHEGQAMRPTEELRLDPGRELLMSLQVDVPAKAVVVELFRLDGSVVATERIGFEAPTQREILAAIFESVSSVQAAHGSIYALGFGVLGLIAQGSVPTLFDIEGVEGKWQACQPSQILPPLESIGVVRAWTDVACKVKGLSAQLRVDDRLAYFEYTGRSFRLSDMQQGRIHLGGQGTGGSLYHQTVKPDGPQCYCGRRGCLSVFVEQGGIPEDLLAEGLKRVLDRIHADHVGLEWRGQTPGLQQLLKSRGVIGVYPIDDGQALASSGLRMLTIEAALRHRFETIGS